MTKLSKEIKHSIAEKVKLAEKSSSLEFVPVFVHASARYRLYRVFVAAMISLCTMSYFLFLGWATSIYLALGFSWGLGIVVFFILEWPPLLSKLLPRSIKQVEVEEAAKLKFLEYEVFATENRTGILIFISELERSVYLMADKGICQKVPAEELSALANLLARELALANTKQVVGDVFLSAISQLSQKLSAEFPPNARKNDQLANTVRD